MPSIWAIAIGALLIFGGLLGWTCRDQYEETLAQEYRFLESHAHFGDTQLAGALRSIDALLQSVINDQLSSQMLPPETVRRHQLAILKDFPEIHFLITTDNRGHVVTAESLDDPASAAAVRKFDTSQRDYFNVHRDAKPEDKYRYQVSRPFETITNRYTISISRAIRGKDGQFQGVALVSLAPTYFEAVLRQALPEGPSGAATLLNRFGDVIYRLPGAEAYVGRNLAGRSAFQEFLSSDVRLTHHLSLGLDGHRRLLVYSKIGDTSLGIAVSSQLDDVLAGWRHNLWLRILSFTLTATLTLGLAWQIQRRTLARQATHEIERRFRAYFERSMVGMATTSTEKGWIDVNPALCEMLGYSAEELSGKTWAELTYPEDLAADVLRFNRLLAGEINEYEMDKRFVRSNGDVVYTHLAVRAVRKPDSTIDYLVALVEDITERKRNEAELLAAKKIAEITNIAKTRVLASVSHDLRQPLYAAQLFVDSLISTSLDSHQLASANKAQQALKAISNQLSLLLDLSRLEEDDAQITKQDKSTIELFEGLSDIYGAIARKANVRLLFHPTELVLHTDQNMLSRLLGNLIDNAIKFSPGGTVLVCVRRTKGGHMVQVRDNGRGVADIHHETVFEDFYQIGNSERNPDAGYGLGLSIISRISRLLGTQVRVASAVGKGSVFSVVMPD